MKIFRIKTTLENNETTTFDIRVNDDMKMPTLRETVKTIKQNNVEHNVTNIQLIMKYSESEYKYVKTLNASLI